MFTIRWNDGHADWQIEFSNFGKAREYLSHVFYPATLTNDQGVTIGGVRPVRPEERRSTRHKWVRWIEGDVIGTKTNQVPIVTASPFERRRRMSVE